MNNFKKKLKESALLDTPKVSINWLDKNYESKCMIIENLIINSKNSVSESLLLHKVLNSGEIIFELTKSVEPSKRADLILDFEKELKEKVDEGLYITILPLGDKNSLRKLRGIKIESSN